MVVVLCSVLLVRESEGVSGTKRSGGSGSGDGGSQGSDGTGGGKGSDGTGGRKVEESSGGSKVKESKKGRSRRRHKKKKKTKAAKGRRNDRMLFCLVIVFGCYVWRVCFVGCFVMCIGLLFLWFEMVRNVCCCG